MSTTITIKNLPDELHEELKARAARHRRSLNSEILVILENWVHRKRRSPEQVLASIRALREGMKDKGVWMTDEEIERAIEEGRH